MIEWRSGLAALALLAWAGAGGAAAETFAGTTAFERGDFETALEELTPEAKKGDPEAIYTLGRMYYAGLGVKRDRKKAAELFRRAAEMGHAGAQQEYGTALALGDGVKQNVPEALKWLMIAAQAGNERAREYAVQLGKHMPSGVLAEIRMQAVAWKTKRKNTAGTAQP